jgi:membrane-bound serine protease (ClpP class)
MLALAAAFAFTAGGAHAQSKEIVELRLDGVVDPFVASYVEDGIASAADDDATAVLLTIDTPGGLDSAMRKITQAILNSPVPVITYVSPEGARAASAGTFVLLSGSVAAMTPGTNVGAAHPVGVSGAIESEKAVEDSVAYIRSIAEARDRNADWAESAVRDSVSVTAEEALRLDVIDLIEPDVTSLLEAVNGRTVPVANGETVTLDTTGATVTDQGMAFLLELKAPGVGAFTVVGVILLVAGALTLFEPSVPNAHVSWWVIVPVAAIAAGFFGLILGALMQARRLPVQMRTTNLIGATGVVTTSLTPIGVVHVASESWSAVSTSGPVPAGTRVMIVDVDGLRLKVSPVETGRGAAPTDPDIPVSEMAKKLGTLERADPRPT